jgi:hypothetical protein
VEELAEVLAKFDYTIDDLVDLKWGYTFTEGIYFHTRIYSRRHQEDIISSKFVDM